MRPSQWQFGCEYLSKCIFGPQYLTLNRCCADCPLPGSGHDFWLDFVFISVAVLGPQPLCLKVTCFYSWPCCSSSQFIYIFFLVFHSRREAQPEIIIYEFALLSPFWKWSESPVRIVHLVIFWLSSGICSFLCPTTRSARERCICVFTFSWKRKFTINQFICMQFNVSYAHKSIDAV